MRGKSPPSLALCCSLPLLLGGDAKHIPLKPPQIKFKWGQTLFCLSMKCVPHINQGLSLF